MEKKNSKNTRNSKSENIKRAISLAVPFIEEYGLVEWGGASIREYCKHVDLTYQTHYNYLDNDEYKTAITDAKKVFESKVEKGAVKTLYRLSEGFYYTETTKVVRGGVEVEKKEVEKYSTPNLGATIFILTNMMPEVWKNRQNTDLTSQGNAMPNIILGAETSKNMPKLATKEEDIEK